MNTFKTYFFALALGSLVGLAILAAMKPAGQTAKANAFAQAVDCMQTAETKAAAGGADQALWEAKGAACKRTVIDAQRRALQGPAASTRS